MYGRREGGLPSGHGGKVGQGQVRSRGEDTELVDKKEEEEANRLEGYFCPLTLFSLPSTLRNYYFISLVS